VRWAPGRAASTPRCRGGGGAGPGRRGGGAGAGRAPRGGPPHQRAVSVGVVRLDGLDQLVADREHRIQRRLRVLQDHRDATTTDAPHLALCLVEQVLALQTDYALDDPRHRSRLKPQQGQRRHRLATAGLAHDAECLALADREAHAVDGPHPAPPRKAVGVEVLDLEDDVPDLSSHLPYFVALIRWKWVDRPAPSPG